MKSKTVLVNKIFALCLCLFFSFSNADEQLTIKVDGHDYKVSSNVNKKHSELVNLIVRSDITVEQKKSFLALINDFSPQKREQLKKKLLQLKYLQKRQAANQRIINKPHMAMGTSESLLNTPLLRLNSPMHIAKIEDSDIDQAEQYLVTVSKDKTAKVWSLKNKELLQTLRVPIGSVLEGRLYSVAVSPNGNWAAVGGWTQVGDGDSHVFEMDKEDYDFNDLTFDFNVFIFDILSGEILHRISGLQDSVTNLCTNHDASRLSAVVGGAGVVTWETENWGEIWQDSDYNDLAMDCVYVNDRLITTAIDGYLRFYDKSGNLTKKKELSNGKKPDGISISPDNRRIAVGSYDSNGVSVYNIDNFRHLFSPDVSSMKKGTLSQVGWSKDTDKLYAGGYYFENSYSPLIDWQKKGKGEVNKVQVDNKNIAISSISPLKGGSVVVATQSPSLLILTNGKIREKFENILIDNRRNDELLYSHIHNRGDVMFMDYSNKQMMLFSITARKLLTLSNKRAIEVSEQGFFPAVKNENAFPLTDWKGKSNPQFAGKNLFETRNELNPFFSFSDELNGDGFALGSSKNIMSFDKFGHLNWYLATPGAVRGCNISEDGKIIIAALGDGTIRWYRYSDGQELLALFINKETKEWVVWTPSGYYDASAGGDSMIGWHINHGLDKTPSFYPVSTLKATYYKPQVIQNILTTLDEQKALEQAGVKMQDPSKLINEVPPLISILNYHYGDTFNQSKVRLSLKVINNYGTSKIKILVDGQPLKTKRVMPLITRETQKKSIVVDLPKRDVTLTVLASNYFGTSPAQSVKLKWNGDGSHTVGKNDKPNLYVLAVGTDKYSTKEANLNFPLKDAKDFENLFKTQKSDKYGTVETKLIANGKKDDVLSGLDWLRQRMTSNDVAMLFFAGHGLNDREGVYHLINTDTDPNDIANTSVSYKTIKSSLANMLGRRLLFIDTCHSGNVWGGSGQSGYSLADVNGIMNDLSAPENGVIVFSSSTGQQESFEDVSWGNGAFTKVLLEGLKGGADSNADNQIDLNEIKEHVETGVSKLTQGKQTPKVIKPGLVPVFSVL